MCALSGRSSWLFSIPLPASPAPVYSYLIKRYCSCLLSVLETKKAFMSFQAQAFFLDICVGEISRNGNIRSYAKCNFSSVSKNQTVSPSECIIFHCPISETSSCPVSSSALGFHSLLTLVHLMCAAWPFTVVVISIVLWLAAAYSLLVFRAYIL